MILPLLLNSVWNAFIWLNPKSGNLGETIRKHVSQFKESHPQAISMLQHLYADDLSCSASDSEEALTIYKEAKEFLGKGGFNLQKWNSNDKEVLREIRLIGALNNNEGKPNVCREGWIIWRANRRNNTKLGFYNTKPIL